MRARPSVNMQWKNMDICMDLYCACGVTSHADGWSFGFVQCPCCDRIYKLTHQVEMAQVSRLHDEYVPDNPLRASL